MKTYLRAAALGLLLAAVMSDVHAQTTKPADLARSHATTLNLSATGETTLAPDTANIALGATTDAKSAAQAMADNAARMNQAMAALKAAGIAAKDIRTSGLSLNAQYAFEQGQPPRLTGYQASDQLHVTIHDLTRLGAILDAAVEAGVNQVNAINFGLADPTAAQNTARRDAVRALQAKADLYTQATGYKVARLIALSEGAGLDGPRATAPMMMTEARMQRLPTVVAPGELTVRVEINGRYELSR